ncbi:MAG: hypothetical protein KF688_04610 [Pirellulales bacterium]|nr:hypothetical protein [Pirellulales bacterium]
MKDLATAFLAVVASCASIALAEERSQTLGEAKQPRRTSAGSDRETPLEKMIVLAHTESLPRCDQIILYALDPRDFDPRVSRGGELERDSIPPESSFPIHPYGKDARILNEVVLSGNDATEIVEAWRSLSFDRLAGAFCHFPVYGLRFYREEQLLFETSLCWQCSNFYLPMATEVYDQLQQRRVKHQWYGFKKGKESDRLRELLKRRLPQFAEPPNVAGKKE